MAVAAAPLDARVLDLCTGTGVLGIQAALLGAREVLAYDINPRAVACVADNARRVGVEVDARLGTLTDAVAERPFDLVVSNPPYVPSPTRPEGVGIHRAWDAGDDGRVVLDPLCDAVGDLLTPDGTMLIVHSEFSGVPETLRRLTAAGAVADVAAANAPAVVVAEDRPFDEQRATARALDRAGLAVALDAWPDPAAWPDLLRRARALSADLRTATEIDGAAARAAAAIESVAG